LSGGDELTAARVGRAHGLDGSFYVTGPLTRLLTVGTTVSVRRAPVARGDRRPNDPDVAEIVRRAGTDARPIVRLAGIEDRVAAEALRGAELAVAREAAPELGEHEWWAHELEGCDVYDEQGRALGVVARMLALPSCEALEVERTGSRPLLVPMVADAIRKIDVDARRVEVDASFLDLSEDADGA
jgi:16S rRNA processing protein RimM